MLVILGLLTGGILAGQSLIRAAELRAVSTEFSRYATATQSFRDRFFSVPGDMANATKLWGVSTACSGGSTSGTCDGNGDGALGYPSVIGASGEMFQFWRQLALAGLLEGNYSGTGGSGGWVDSGIGVNVPKSRMSSGGWSAYNWPIYLANIGDYYRYCGSFSGCTIEMGNMFTFGAAHTSTLTDSPVLKSEEAWNIDTKIDDGKPAIGRVMAESFPNGFGAASSCTTSISYTDLTGLYNLSGNSAQCALNFIKLF